MLDLAIMLFLDIIVIVIFIVIVIGNVVYFVVYLCYRLDLVLCIFEKTN